MDYLIICVAVAVLVAWLMNRQERKHAERRERLEHLHAAEVKQWQEISEERWRRYMESEAKLRAVAYVLGRTLKLDPFGTHFIDEKGKPLKLHAIVEEEIKRATPLHHTDNPLDGANRILAERGKASGPEPV